MEFVWYIVMIAVPGLIEFILCRIIHKPWPRFVLPVLLLITSVSLFLYGKFAVLEGFKDLAFMLSGIFLFIAFLSSFVVALVYSIVAEKHKKGM
jgi:hypothetical protein